MVKGFVVRGIGAGNDQTPSQMARIRSNDGGCWDGLLVQEPIQVTASRGGCFLSALRRRVGRVRGVERRGVLPDEWLPVGALLGLVGVVGRGLGPGGFLPGLAAQPGSIEHGGKEIVLLSNRSS